MIDGRISSFVKLIRSKDVEWLLRRRPSAFCLLALIALRARRVEKDHNLDNVEIGEAFIGDAENYGASPQVYRTDKKFLAKHNLATFKPTNKGTIAKIIDTTIFDINADYVTNQEANNQHSSNKHATTNNNVNNEKKTNNLPKVTDFSFRKNVSSPTSTAVTVIPTTSNSNDIQKISEYFLEKMQIPKEDCAYSESQKYWSLLLRESGTGIDGVKFLIDIASGDEFLKPNITSSRDLYFKRIKLMTRSRSSRPTIAVYRQEGGEQ